MPSIARPDVTVEVEFVNPTVTPVIPSLPACAVGPCFRIVDAFDDSGDVQSSALAGTYRDGYGTVAYDLPNLGTQDSLSGFEDDVRVFLLLGTVTTELHGESDEESITSGEATGQYNYEGGDPDTSTLADGSARFSDLGVLAGDVVRISYRGVSVDLPVVSVTTNTELVVDGTAVPEDLDDIDYEVVRNPAQFIVSSGSQAKYIFGDSDDYLTISTQSDGAYAGSLGDQLSLVIQETDVYSAGSDLSVGDVIFTSASGGFVVNLAHAIGDVSVHSYYVGLPGAAGVLLHVTYIVSATELLIATGLGAGLSSQTYVAGANLTADATGTAGAYDHTGGAYERVFTKAGSHFLTSIPNGGAHTPPTNETWAQLTKTMGAGADGLYRVATVESDTEITLEGGTNPGADMGGVAWHIITAKDGGGVGVGVYETDGTTGALTDALAVTGTFDEIPAPVTNYAVVIGSTDYAIESVTDATHLVLADDATSGPDQTYQAVVTTAAMLLEWDEDNKHIKVTLERDDGVSVGTYAELEDAITDDENVSYNAEVAAIVTAAVSGDDDLVVGIYALDGGADNQDLLLDADLLGSTTPTALVYVSYKALRLDVTALATDPTLMSYDDAADITSDHGDLTTDNPLPLALYFMLLNSGSKTVYGLGVDEVSAAKPNGTVLAYSRALSFLGGQSVYFLVPLTDDPVVHQAVQVHVDAMSAAENKAPRVCYISEGMPLYATAELTSSGTDLNTEDDFDETGLITASADFSEAGVLVGDILVVSARSSADDAPDAALGTLGPLYGFTVSEVAPDSDNFSLVLDVDGHTAMAEEWNSLVDVSFSVYRSGAAISEKADQVSAISDLSESFADRRVLHHWPPSVKSTVTGTEEWMDGFYLAAAWAGVKSRVAPAQGLSNAGVAGFTGCRYSNGYFTEAQLNEIAGGGTWISWQPRANGALQCRHQLSTDVSTTEYQEHSITTALDYAAMLFRASLTKQVGKFNITQSFLDSLSTTCEGLCRFLEDTHVFDSCRLHSVERDTVNPTQINITILVEVLYPGNYLAVTIQV